LLLNENLCRQRDPHPQIEFDFGEKHNLYIKMCIVLNEDHF